MSCYNMGIIIHPRGKSLCCTACKWACASSPSFPTCSVSAQTQTLQNDSLLELTPVSLKSVKTSGKMSMGYGICIVILVVGHFYILGNWVTARMTMQMHLISRLTLFWSWRGSLWLWFGLWQLWFGLWQLWFGLWFWSPWSSWSQIRLSYVYNKDKKRLWHDTKWQWIKLHDRLTDEVRRKFATIPGSPSGLTGTNGSSPGGGGLPPPTINAYSINKLLLTPCIKT